MKFPVAILPSADYTLFFVARYDGSTRGRIFQGLNKNFIFGFHNGRAGVAYHHNSIGCGFITEGIDLHGYDWVIGTDRSNYFRSNGVDRTTPNHAHCSDFDTLAINVGNEGGEKSDFAIQSLLVYNRKLTDADVLKVEAWLTVQQPTFTPANLQVHARVENFDALS